MKSNTKISAFILSVVLLGSCQNYDELVLNKNLPTSAPPSLILTGILVHMNEQNAWSGRQGSQTAAQFYLSTYDYYGTNNYDQEPFTKTKNNFEYVGTPPGGGTVQSGGTLQNIVQMEIEAKKAGKADLNPYGALAKFLKAYYYNLMSQKLGDVPLSEALQGSAVVTPKYDTQKDVYIQILKWLEDSNSDFAQLIDANDATLLGDPFLANDLRKWQKVVNSFALRVLVSLSKKEADTDLAIASKFSAIVGDPAKYPVMAALEDNLQFIYSASYNPYPMNPTSQGRDATRQNVGSAFLNLTTTLHDPRTFIAATPAPAQIADGKTFDDFDAYVGAEAGLGMSDLGNNSQGGMYSYINALRYYFDFGGSKAEPGLIIGYPEMCFNIAEGFNRGWASGSAEDWYNKGIRASMAFFGITEGGSITVGNNTTTVVYGTVSTSIDDYIAQATVQYQGGAAGLTQILNQKYIAFWQNSNWEAFFNQRRTGVPVFSSGPGTGNGGVGKIAKRWQYPVAEAAANAANYQEAIDRQFNGADNLDGVLWIVQ